ncbi:MAG: hypothetical protein KAT05_11070, partial [Spirochaetes bacterium]|nr:hypothetical protein [Spirochaetota bacterium]
ATNDEEIAGKMLFAVDSYIDTRYPSDMGLLPEGKPSIEKAKLFYNFANETFKKVTKLLSF